MTGEKDTASSVRISLTAGFVCAAIIGFGLMPKYYGLEDGFCIARPIGLQSITDYRLWYPWLCFPSSHLLATALVVIPPYMLARVAQERLENSRAYSLFSGDDSLYTYAFFSVLAVNAFIRLFLPGEYAGELGFLGSLVRLFILTVLVMIPIFPLAMIAFASIAFGMLVHFVLNIPLIWAYLFTVHPAEEHVLGKTTGTIDAPDVRAALGKEPTSAAHAKALRARLKAMHEETDKTLAKLKAEHERLTKYRNLQTELKEDEAELAEKILEMEKKS